jgi:membrane protease YdiL (CAAX protease family)
MRNEAIKEVVLFFALTLFMMYSICFSVVLFRTQLEAFSESYLGGAPVDLFLYPAAFSPTIVALVLTGILGGSAGLKRLFKNVFRLKVGIGWIAVSFLIIPTYWLVAALIRWTLHGIPIEWGNWLVRIWMLLLTGFLFSGSGLAAFGEEIGWRGYALPRLLEGLNPVAAGIVVGVFAGFWHLPGWFIEGLYFQHEDFARFIGGAIVVGVVMAWLYVNVKGSVLFAGIVPHLMGNVSSPRNGELAVEGWEGLSYVAVFTVILVALNLRSLSNAAPPWNRAYSPQFYRD